MLATTKNGLNLVELLEKVAKSSGLDSIVAKSVLHQLNSCPLKNNEVCRKLVDKGWELVANYYEEWEPELDSGYRWELVAHSW